jgi:hypothetical protein
VRRVLRRLRALSESECYCRCYGTGQETVRLIAVERRSRPEAPRLTGERIRHAFERRLDVRGPESEAAA